LFKYKAAYTPGLEKKAKSSQQKRRLKTKLI